MVNLSFVTYFFACVCVSVYKCVGGCTYMHVYVEARGQPEVVFLSNDILFFETESLTGAGSLIGLD